MNSSKSESKNKDIRVLRLLKLIAQLESIIDLHRKSGDETSLKGNLYEKNKLVIELKSLLKEQYNLNINLEEAA